MGATGTQTVGAYRVKQLRVEGLESRVLLAADVWVDDDWVGLLIGTDPDGLGPATAIGTDAFATIQAGVDAVDVAGTVTVLDGTYVENVAINKNFALSVSQRTRQHNHRRRFRYQRTRRHSGNWRHYRGDDR